jgi:hypothetical protein
MAAGWFIGPSGRQMAREWGVSVYRFPSNGATVKVAQELARHSSPLLTLGRYAHVQLLDQTRALDALPAIQAPGANVVALKATGTGGSTNRL